ncbi:hypothetical protein [Bradyrhizobium sp. NP1]|uniref:hypothetical protein n=1 Tax=Bradyrhizobium sp. NP1 TaxID=3049772 RepID=UPI0025A6334B|nr:hypothetical protein [Bradyrhizobium sp. NP1]WJR76478.1 hypothetical protein QOU61_27495 [Bradyrhizobium sp. NP1]
MPALFFAVGVIAFIWSAVKSQIVYYSVRDSFPPQFQDDLNARYAFSVYALMPSTPLPLQAEYMKSLWGFCVSFLCFSLGCFSMQNVVLGCFLLIGFILVVFSTFKSWRTYKENCNRALMKSNEEH